MLPKKYRTEIKEKLYEIEHKENLSEGEKEENDEYLRKLVRILNDKEKHSPYDRDDLDYYGIRDIEILFDEAIGKDYCKPILVKVLLRKIINIMKAEGIRKKDYQ